MAARNKTQVPTMNKNVIPIRKDVIPENIFQMIDDYMHGNLTAIHIIGVTLDRKVISTSAGEVPAEISQFDIKKRG